MPHNGNNRGSHIECTNTEPRGNPVAVNCGGICLIPEDCETEARISVGGPNANIMGGGIRKYRGVLRKCRKWQARVSNKIKADGTENRVHLGMFPTAEMAAIAFDAAVLHLKADKSGSRLNFQKYSAHIKSVLQSCSPSETDENLKCVARKAAENIFPLISVENKGPELEVSPLVAQEPKDQPLEVSPVMSATTIGTASASLMSSNIGMPDSIPNVEYTIVPMPAKQRIKVAARAAGSVRAANARAHQLQRKIHVDQQKSAIPINHQIQLGQRWSDKRGALDSTISSFPVIDESLQQCTNLCSSAQNDINQQIPHRKPTGMRDSIPDSIPNADYTIVPLRVRQRIKVADRAAGNVTTANARAQQLPRKIDVDQQENVNAVYHQIRHGQPSSDKSGGADNSVSSLL